MCTYAPNSLRIRACFFIVYSHCFLYCVHAAQSISALTKSGSQKKSPVEEYLTQHVKPLIPSQANAAANRDKGPAVVDINSSDATSNNHDGTDKSEPGSPLALIICESAIRCVDLLR